MVRSKPLTQPPVKKSGKEKKMKVLAICLSIALTALTVCGNINSLNANGVNVANNNCGSNNDVNVANNNDGSNNDVNVANNNDGSNNDVNVADNNRDNDSEYSADHRSTHG
jgi:hypothetical protein